jgi:uncharacterized protein (DUF1499 family)
MPQIRTNDFPIDFARLERTAKPNQMLVLPVGFASAEAPDLESPVFDIPADGLMEALEQVLVSKMRSRVLQKDRSLRQVQLVARTAVLRFPDDIWIQVLPDGAEQSALAIYSRSRYGYSDLGVNRRRVERWLGEIAQRVRG